MKRSTITELSSFDRHLNAKYGKPIYMVAHVIEECVHFLNLDKLTLVQCHLHMLHASPVMSIICNNETKNNYKV